jgi:DNA ligase-1
MKNLRSTTLLCILLLTTNRVFALDSPALLLARPFQPDIELSHYWVSEKLDGVRAYWDGRQLLTRQGNIIHAPATLLNQLPAEPLDGELWLGRGQFEQTVAIVRKQQPDLQQWQAIRYMIFDLPASPLAFEQRLARLQQLLNDPHAAVQLIPHRQYSDQAALQQALQSVLQLGGEGLMLHRADSHYRPGRHQDLLKLKPFADAEAVVLSYRPGKGKYRGLMGSLLVKDQQGQQFYIGSGFTDQQRKNPPAIGSVISFRHNGFTAYGIPRHARFLRIRADHDF